MKMSFNVNAAEQYDVKCGECGAPMKLRESKKILNKEGAPRKFYGCSRFPACYGSHGAHPNGAPLGIPANSETKAARIAAHEVFDELWKSGRMKRKEAYQLLADTMGVEEIHFATMTKEKCMEAIKVLEEEIL